AAARAAASSTPAGPGDRLPAAPARRREPRRGANVSQRRGVSHRGAPPASRGARPPGLAETRHASASRAATSSTYAPRALAAGTRRNADHSQAPASTTAVITATVAHSGSHSTTASSTAASTTAVDRKSTRLNSSHVEKSYAV